MTRLEEAYERLYSAYGPQHWWPARSRFEVMVGSVLVQHSAWRNVERVIAQLEAARLLEPRSLARCDETRLAELVRPAGTPSVKARRLLALATHVVERYGGSLDRMFDRIQHAERLQVVREALLGVHGVGPETADAILLYAGGAPTFVLDAYARRVLKRHGWGDSEGPYGQVQRWCESQLPRDARLFNELHALFVRVAREHCKSRSPQCEGCPLEEM